MKKVFSNHQTVVETWAEGMQNEGRGGNIFFEKEIIYSYGHHYPMAKIYQNLVLLNSNSYSVSTCKHRGFVRTIFHHRGIPIIEVPDVTNLHNIDNLKYLKTKYKEYYKLTKRGLMTSQWNYIYYIDCLNDYRILYNEIYNTDKLRIYENEIVLNKYKKIREDIFKDREKRTIDNVLMPRNIFKKIQDKTLTPKYIFNEKNAQRRSVLLKIYTYERLLQNTDSKIIHTDRDYELFLIKTPKTEKVYDRWNKTTIELPEDIMLIKVKCPSTGAYFVLRVPTTMKRCKEALAWTFDMSEADYILEMET